MTQQHRDLCASAASPTTANGPALTGMAAPAVGLAEAGLVHDLGNLIQVASSALTLLARDPGMPAARSGAMLQQARASLDHASALVKSTIGLVRGRLCATQARADVAACLDDIVALVEAMGDRALSLEVDVERGLPPARCDAHGLRNAVLNLVFNARDAMPGGGCVVLRAGRASRGDPRELEISVGDSGIGMSRATIERAFEPFFTTKPDGLGGVGLPMVRRFVDEAGGAIAVDSAPGSGTCVTLRIPAADTASPRQETRP